MKKILSIWIFTFLISTEISATEKEVILEIKKDPFAVEIEGKEKKKEETGIKTKEEKLKFKLIGSAISDEKKIVLIELDGEKYLLSEGDSIQNIKIKKVENGYIQLTVGKEEFRIRF